MLSKIKEQSNGASNVTDEGISQHKHIRYFYSIYYLQDIFREPLGYI